LKIDDCEQGGPLYFCLGMCVNKVCFMWMSWWDFVVSSSLDGCLF